ncbi:hypothetical protein CH364_18555 [Leptospira harrisiae]|uniref:AbiTii domain-containing protein n=1 Tax=Leptospira harrisiae TaxID=2023189 RepID=A0A2N0AFB5_9LEPT|nr:hypothetical protein [Leptospira harrisiae]PJZ82995.1 hypothetical protein CH364_18555 [Leptospira harrisiae]
MEKSLVIELQQDLYDSSSKVTDLLRKAYIISRKLKVTTLENWIKKELNGYSGQKEIPEYRRVYGQVVAWNPHHGWQPVIFNQKTMQDEVSTREIVQSVPELEDLIQNGQNGLAIPLPDEFSKLMNYQTKVRINLVTTQLTGIIETIKNILLEWSLKLEEDGIIGANMSFSKDEINKAQNINYTVNNIFKNINGSQIVNDSENTSITNSEFSLDILKEIIAVLKDNIHNKDINQKDRAKLNTEIAKIDNESQKEKPKISILMESAKTIRNILEGMTGSIIASGIISKYQNFFQF